MLGGSPSGKLMGRGRLLKLMHLLVLLWMLDVLLLLRVVLHGNVLRLLIKLDLTEKFLQKPRKQNKIIHNIRTN